MSITQENEQLVFDPGQIICQQGEPGGDLYFIKEGTIEIYTLLEGREIILSQMQAGEVLGTLTCLTNEARLASARAASQVIIQRIPHAKIKNLVKDLPPWMKIVLKDFTNRLQSMNQSYSEMVSKYHDSLEQQITPLYTSIQFANAIAACAKTLSTQLDDIPAVLPEALLDYIEPILARERKELEDIFQVFVDSGMVVLRVEQEKKRKYLTLENAEKLKSYNAFMELCKRKKIKKLLETQFAHKELRVMGGLLRYAKSMNFQRDRDIKLNIAELEAGMEKKTGQAFELEALKQADTLKLLRLEGEGQAQAVVFNPRELSHMIAHLSAYKKLLAMKPS